MAVVSALDLQDQIAPGGGTREMDRIERGLTARVVEAPLGKAEPPLELLGDGNRVLRWSGEVSAPLDLGLHGGDDRGVGVSHAHRAEAVVEVDVLVAVHVPNA